MLHDKVLSMVRCTTEKRTSTRLHGLKMNQRIKDLAEQCYYDDNVRPDGSRISECEFIIFDKQKFAELIVRECSQMVHDSHPDDLPFVGGKMLVHFGVE